jgi:hypothetical protein
LITDRTQEDVDSAKNIIDSKVKLFLELTVEDLQILERGTIGIGTINRVGSKQEELKNKMETNGYFVENIETKIWDYNDIFGETDFLQLINNTILLRDAFFVYSNTPADVYLSYDYKNINNLEKILVDMENILDYMIANFRECGTFYSGEG